MKTKLLQLFSCVTVIAILLSGCASGQRESSSEASALSGSETTQAADNSPSTDINSGTEKESSTTGSESVPNQADSSLSGTNSQNKSDVSSGGETSDNRPNGSASSNTQQTKPTVESTSPVSEPSDTSITEESKVEKMNLQIGNSSFTATLESNAAVDALVDMMREAPVVIEMSDYSGFEKVGPLGTSLPTSNKQTTTQSGDIVLYNGNQIVIFYGSNSWSYTRLGKIDDLSGWKDALGSGDVTVTFSLK